MNLIERRGTSNFIRYLLIFLIFFISFFIVFLFNNAKVDLVKKDLDNRALDFKIKNVLVENNSFNIDIYDSSNDLSDADSFLFVFEGKRISESFEILSENVLRSNNIYSFSVGLKNLSSEEVINFSFTPVFEAGIFSKKIEGKKTSKNVGKNNVDGISGGVEDIVNLSSNSRESSDSGSSSGSSGPSGSSGGSSSGDSSESSADVLECGNKMNFSYPIYNSEESDLVFAENILFQSGIYSISDDFIYKKAYYSDDGIVWNEFNLSGDSYCSENFWINSSASFEINNFNYVVYSSCSFSEEVDSCFSGNETWNLYVKDKKKIEDSLAYWSFNNYSSDFILDDSINDYNAIVFGPDESFGFSDGGINFSLGDHLDLGSWNIYNDEASFSFWIRVENDSMDGARVFIKGNSSFMSWGVFLDRVDGYYYPSFYALTDEGSSQLRSGISIDENWHNVIFDYNGNEIDLYIDGEFSGGVSLSGDLVVNGNQILIGEHFNRFHEYSFSGELDEFFVFNRSLSKAEIKSLSSWSVQEDPCEIMNCNDYNSCTVDSCLDGECVNSLIEGCEIGGDTQDDVPYIIPEILTADFFSNKVYVDPSLLSDGDGSLNNPRNTLDITFQSDTAYLIKSGATFTGSVGGYFEDVYVGSYGSGGKPVIHGTFGVGDNSRNLTIDGLRIQREGVGSYRQLLRLPDTSASYITIANSEIIGIDSGSGYPFYNMKGGGRNLVFYHNEFAYCRNDGIYGGLFENSTFVSNYFHHQNMGGVDSIDSTGDGIQMEDADASNVYFANNYMDRSHTIWKFALIVNSYLSKSENFVAEYNTFIAPRQGNGGAAVRWHAGTDNKLRRNLFDVSTGLLAVAGHILHQNQTAPYGMRDNHKVGSGPLCYDVDQMTQPEYNNLEFSNFDEYGSYLSSNPSIGQYGSDIDPENFWS